MGGSAGSVGARDTGGRAAAHDYCGGGELFGITELLFLEPLRDANIIYNFHFYDPHIFTHQGATWSTNFQHYLTKLPYPSTPENVQSAVTQAPDAVNQLLVVRFGVDLWNAERIARRLRRWRHGGNAGTCR